MVLCAAVACNNRSSHKNKAQKAKEAAGVIIAFFRFPVDAKMRQIWQNAVHRKDWTPSEASRLCSEHFALDSYSSFEPRIRLKEDAVPTLFFNHCDPVLTKDNIEKLRKNTILDSKVGFNSRLLENGDLKLKISKAKIVFPPSPVSCCEASPSPGTESPTMFIIEELPVSIAYQDSDYSLPISSSNEHANHFIPISAPIEHSNPFIPISASNKLSKPIAISAPIVDSKPIFISVPIENFNYSYPMSTVASNNFVFQDCSVSAVKVKNEYVKESSISFSNNTLKTKASSHQNSSKLLKLKRRYRKKLISLQKQRLAEKLLFKKKIKLLTFQKKRLKKKILEMKLGNQNLTVPNNDSTVEEEILSTNGS